MTVSVQDTVFQHVGNGVTTVFAYGCQVPTATDLEVYLDDVLQTSGYTVAGIGTPTGGTVTFSVAPANLAQIRLERVIELERTTDYQQNGDFLSRVVNPDFDRLWMALQGHLSTLKRAIVVPRSDTVPPNPLPAAADRANKLLSFDATGQPVAVAPAAQSATALQALLLTSAGASMIGFDSTMLDQQIKNRIVRTVDTFAAVRALDTTKYTRAFTHGKAAAGDGGQGQYYYDAADITSADDDYFVLVGPGGQRWKRLRLIWQTATQATDGAATLFARQTSHTGGAPGVTSSALGASTVVVGAGVANFEWTFLATMDNSATAGENVAIYGQAKKRAQGPTWAGCFEIQDIYATDPATGASLGIEVTCSANNTDTGLLRNGVNVVAGKLVGGGTDCEWGRGFWTSAGSNTRYVEAFSNTSPFRISAFKNSGDASLFAGSATFKDTGKATNGVDTTGATYTGSALLMAAGQSIGFDATATVKAFESAGRLVLSGGRVQMSSGFYIPASGNTSATASAGASGAPPAQVAGYLIFQVDGTNFKLPYYAN